MEKEHTIIFKEPDFENDSAFFRIVSSSFIDSIRETLKNDPYYLLKDEKFKNKDVSNIGFKSFIEGRPSLRNMSKYLEGSIYTFSCEKKNGKCYEYIVESVKKMISNGSRRAIVTMSDRLLDYENSETNLDMDVSCLSSIHYYKNKVTLFFRASDIENELIIDILTIYDHFIKCVYDHDVLIDVMLSTCQNINNFKNVLHNEDFKN